MKKINLEINGSIHVNHYPLEKLNPLVFLGDQIMLANGYCLRSYFCMLETYPVLQQLSEFFRGAIERYHEISEADAGYLALKQLEFGKTIEMIGFPGKPRLEIYNSLRSAGQEEGLEIRTIDLSGLLDVPLRLGKLRHIVFGDQVDVLEFETACTLFEFIDGIAWELGFHTTPGECEIRR
ncbi:MAG: hypothetical protein RBT11_10435 [Desulfobacterales bacterium]|jgi:hypothetical protein|nr:hypothetical protein [Desulfobacterales bacterium]